MQKIKIYTTITLLFTTLLSAQGFKLSDYQAPEISRKALWIEYNYHQNSRSNNFDENDGFLLAKFDLFKKKSDWEIKTNNSAGFGGGLGYLAQSDNNLSYYFKDNYFINSQLTTEITSPAKLINSNNNVTFYIGIGRINQVEDARQAIYILDDLKEKELLNNYPDGSKILELAQLFTKLKNDRFLDDREKKIYQITQIDSFFQANNLVKNANATYFTLLNDNWDNCATPERQSGNRFMLGAEGSYMHQASESSTTYIDYNNSSYKGYQNSYTNNYQYGFFIKHQWYYPANLKWQFGNSIKLGYKIFDSNKHQYAKGRNYIYDNSDAYYVNNYTKHDTTEVTRKAYELTDCVELGYYPNSRTSFTFKTTVNIETVKRKKHTYGYDNSFYSYASSYNNNHFKYVEEFDFLDMNTKIEISWFYYYSKNLTMYFKTSGSTTTQIILDNAYKYNHVYSDDDDFDGIHELDVNGSTSFGITYSLF